MIGILCWGEDTATQKLAGVVWNPRTFKFPVRIKRVQGTNFETIVKNPTLKTLRLLVKAARELEKERVSAITTDCGFNAIWQRELSNSVKVPVFTSSLLLVPMIHRMIGKKKVGIITAHKILLTNSHLKAVGINQAGVRIFGMERERGFLSAVSSKKGTLNLRKFETAVIGVARRAATQDPDTAAIVLECTDLSPFAGAIRRVTKLPVFDIVTLVNMVNSGTDREPTKQGV